MAIDWNGLISTAEADLVDFLSNKLMSGFMAQVLIKAGLSFLFPLMGWLVNIIVGLGVKYGDWLTYCMVDDWVNTTHGKAYEDAALKNAQTPDEDPQKAALIKAQKEAFDALIGAS